MKLFIRILLKEFIPYFLLGIVFFTLILFLADLFSNLWKYLSRDIPFSKAFMVSILYVPTALMYSLSIGAMFASAFTLGNLGARNELIAVFGSGVSLFRFILPLGILAVFISAGSFFLEDRLAIPKMKERNILSGELLHIENSKNRARAVAISSGGKIIYYADFYNDMNKSLRGLTVIRLDKENNFDIRVDSRTAQWEKDRGMWLLKNARVFRKSAGGELEQKYYERLRFDWIDEPPSTFQLDTRKLEEMTSREAVEWIHNQKKTGLPYKSYQAKYYQRFTMALTPLLVVIFAGGLGGKFKRNILLMSLLVTIGISSAWYIVRMIATLLSETGLISPLLGAVVPYSVFFIFGLWLFRRAGT